MLAARDAVISLELWVMDFASMVTMEPEYSFGCQQGYSHGNTGE